MGKLHKALAIIGMLGSALSVSAPALAQSDDDPPIVPDAVPSDQAGRSAGSKDTPNQPTRWDDPRLAYSIANGRWKVSFTVVRAYQSGDYAMMFSLASFDVQACQKIEGPRDLCLDVLNALANASRLSGIMMEERGDRAAALALRIATEVFGEDHAETAKALDNVGMLKSARSLYREADPYFRRALATRRAIYPPDDLMVAVSLNNVATNAVELAHLAEAESLLREALAIAEALPAPDDGWTSIVEDGEVVAPKPKATEHPAARLYRGQLADVLDRQGAFRIAEPMHRLNLQATREALGDTHPDTASAWNALGFNLIEQGRFEEARPAFYQAVEIAGRALGQYHEATANYLANLAIATAALEGDAASVPLLRRALEIRIALFGENHASVARTKENIGVALARLGAFEEAEAMYRSALEVSQRLLGDDHPRVAAISANLGVLLSRRGRYKEAAAQLERAIVLLEEAYGPDHPSLAAPNANLGVALFKSYQPDEALAAMMRARRIARMSRPPGHPDRIEAARRLADAHWMLLSPGGESFAFYREGEDDVIARLESSTGFGAEARRELKEWRPLFVGTVRSAWRFARKSS